MSNSFKNIIGLLSVRIKRDHLFIIRASRVFITFLFLFCFGGNARAQMVTTTSLISTPANSCLNQPVTFTATVDEPSATGNVLFLEGATVLGVVALDASGIATLTLSNLSAGEHTIVAEYEGAAPYDGSTSTEIIHVVNTPPVITTQPSPQIVFSGCSATFSLIAEGTEPLVYQWSRDGVNIANSNSSTLTINNITVAQTGNYSVVITNLCGTVTSNTASLSITSLPTASITYGATQFCSSITSPRPVTRTGAAGGVYFSVPAGLDVDSTTGDIIPANSTPGIYSVRYAAVSPSGCATVIASRTITILQSPTVLISSDFCAGGGSVRLTANVTPQPATYLWSNGSTASSILVDKAGPYSLTATSPNGCSSTLFTNVAQELVYNGDFSAGNVGFTSAYGNNQAPYTGGSTGLWPETLYAVDWNANIHHSNFFGTDHTTGNGNFMIVNGAGHDTTTVWRQSFAVQPNTTYYFSAWAMSLNRVSPYAQLKFTVNDSLLGTTAILAPGANTTAGPFNWVRFYGTWNSGSNTFITISIVDLQIAAGGNDFGLDDISFGTLSPFPFAAAPAGSACEGQALVLRSNVTGGSSPYFYSWTGPNGFSSAAKDPVIPVAAMSHAGTYNLTVTDAYSCPVTASAVVTVNQAATVNAGPNQGVCAGTSITLAGTRGGSATSSIWSAPSGTFSNTGSLTSTYTPSITNGTVILTLTSNDPPGLCPAAVSTMIVTVGNATANAGPPRIVCAGKTVNLSATIGGGATSATWSAPSGTFSNINSLNAIYTPTIASGTVTLTLTTNDPAGPCGPVTSTIVITVRPRSNTVQTLTVCQGALPYSWNSQSLTAAGTYQATLTNVNGCDSTVTLTLNVNPNVTSTQTITICQGALPYSWNSQSLTAAGTYQATLTNANGCDSTVTLTLNVNPNVTSTQTITICQNSLPYSWNSQSLTAAGTYQATLTNVNGCDSTVTLTLNVNPNVTSTQTITICQNSLPYSWNSQSLTAAGTYQATLTNVNGCDSTVTLTLNVNPNVTSTQTITICQGALPYSWNSQSLTAAGTYQATLTNVNGCDSTVTLTLNVNPNVTSTQTITICQNSLPYSWNSQSLTAAGTYQATLTNVNGCDSTVTLTLNINPNVTSTQTITICQNSLPYSWNSQSLNAAGTYQATLTNANGCDSTVTLTLNVNPNVTSTQAITICQNSLPYSWNSQSLTAAGTYQATLTNVNGCDSTVTLTLNVNPNVTSTQTITICQNSLPYSWNSQSLTAAGTYQATLTNVNGCDSTVTLTLNVNPNVTSTQTITICQNSLPYSWNSQSLTAAGTYQATLTNVNGCDSTVTLTLNVNPNVTSTQTITICQNSLPYSWNSQSLNAAGTYQATLTNANGCDSTVTLTLNVNPNVTSTQTITICQNSLPYSWNSQSLTNAGTYQATLTNVNGCDSTVTLTLNVNLNVTSTQTITICENSLPYSWNSQSLTTAGTYHATLTNVDGCDSTVTLTLNVNPNVTSTQTITICQNSLPYSWNSQSLTAAGTYLATLPNVNGCDSTVTLTLNVNPNVTSTQTITICQNGLPYSWNSQSLITAGTYQATLPNVNGCDSTVTLTLNVNPNVTSTQTITICQNSLPYSWNSQSLTTAGTYQATLTNVNGCDSTVTLTLNVNLNVTSTQTITICENSLPYSWNSQSLTTAGTYQATLPNVNGCDSTVTLTLNVNPNVTSTQTITICQNSLPYSWNSQSLTAAGTYLATLPNVNGCDSTVTLTLNVNPNVTSTQTITICQNGLPYSWNSQSLITAGTYQATLPNVNGCDSTVTLTLNVNPNVTSTQTITICQNSLPYSWNSQSLTTAGTYQATLTNVNGCDSTVTLTLNVNLNVTSTQTITICENSLPYSWNSQSLTTAGTYHATLTNVDGCDSTVTLTLNVNPNVTSTQTITICQNSLPYSWNSQSLTAAGTYLATLPNVNGCDSTVTLTLNVNPNVTSTQTITICQNGLPYSWNSQSLITAGTYQATLPNVNGCDSTVTLTLNVNPNVTSTQTITICQNSLPYSWNSQSLTTAGTYQATLTNVNGCDSTVTLTLNVNPNVTSTQSITICQNSLPYSWNSQSLTNAGTYQATLTNVNGCDSTAALTLNVNPNVTATENITICEGQLPFTWNGHTLASPGTRTALLQNTNGCDSTVTLHLSVNPIVTGSETITICQGQLPIIWNGQTLIATGSTTATLLNVVGCDSVATLHLNVNPNVTSTQAITICEGALPYNWNNQSLPAAGTYQATLTNANGCDSTVTLTLNVNPNVTSAQTITICQNSLPYSWNSQSLTTADTYQATLTNANGCDSTVTLTLNVNPNVTSTQTITICQNSLPYSWNSQSLTAAGTYQATLTNVNGCDSTITLTLNVNPNVTSNQTIIICQNSLPYSWNIQSLAAAGTYQATLTNVNGCDSTITLTLNVNPNVTSNQTIIICQNSLPYSWNNQSLAGAGTYQATLTNVNGCDSTVTVTLNVNPNVTSNQNITICQNSLPYSWNNQSLAAAGTYQATLTNVNGCDSTVTVTLNVNPNVTSTQTITICQNSLPYSWNSQSLTAAGTYQATLTNVNGCDSTVSLTLNVNPNVTSTQTITICQGALPYSWNSQSLTAAGTYQATLTNANGCDSTITLTLNVNPNVTSTQTITICHGALPYSWNSQSLTAAGTYQATLTNVNGCDSTTTLNLVVNPNVTATENITICAGQLPFTWNGQTLVVAGTRIATLQNVNGCDSTVTLHLSVNPIVIGSETITICEGQLPIIWNGQTLTSAGSTTATLQNVIGCDSIATLYLIVNPNITSTQTITICQGALPYSWISQSLTTAGIYQSTLTNVNGCDSTVTLTLNVNPNVKSTQTITICQGALPYSWNSQSLTAAGTYQETLQNANGCDSTVTLTLNVNPNVTSTQTITVCQGALPYSWNSQSLTAAGTYQATLTNVNGCDSTITLTLNVNPNVTSTQTITICQGALPYSWNSQSLTAAGTYQATLTNVNGCDSTVTLNLVVNPNVTATENITICEGQLPFSWNGQTLVAAGSTTATLQNVAGCDSTVALHLSVNPIVTGSETITICEGQLPFTWNGQTLIAAGSTTATLQNVAGCDSIATLNLNVNPNVSSTQTITICEVALPFSWNNQSLPSAGTYQASLQNGSGCDSTITLTLNVNPNVTSTLDMTICEGALPYSWNGQSLTAAGTFQARLQNANGCDSTVTLTLNVNPNVTSTQTITVCQGALPFSWNTQSLIAAGTYQSTLTNVNGCDSLVTLTLVVNPNVNSQQTITICEGQLPYLWNGQTLTTAGTATALLTSAAGCDSTATLTLIVNPNVTGEQTVTICEASLPYSWNNQVITAAGDYTATLLSATGCDSTATLHLLINPVVTGEETITICEGQLPYIWNGQTLTAAGITTALLQNNKGCDSLATLTLVVDLNVTATETITICEGQLPYSWNGQTLTSAGTSSVTLQNINGCDSLVTLTLVVNPNVTGQEIITICEGQLSYSWNGQILTAAGTTTALLTSAAGCDSTATLTLIVNPNVTGTETITICEGQLPYKWNGQTLTAAGAATVTLQNINGCDSLVTLTLVVNPNVTGQEIITICEGQLPYSWNGQTLTAAGNTSVVLSNAAGCDSTATLTLVVNPNVTGEQTTTICEASLPYSWNNQSITAAGDYTATLVSAAACDSIATLHLLINPVVTGEETITICEAALPYSWNNQSITAAGDYTAALISTVGCDSTTTLHLIVNPVVTGEETITICETALPYSWNNQSITATGDYTATLTSAAGCDSIATLHLIVNPVVTGEETITICETALPYSWNNQSITATGDYTATLTSAAGCDSIATLHLIVNPVVTGEETITICEAALPYSWNNQVPTAAGDYTATLVSVAGCDSIATLHLIVNPVVTGEETIAICEAALPYSWNSQTITVAGDYTSTLASINGCDSIATLHLIINPVVTGEETITICEAALPYSWNSQTITVAGDYTSTLASINGCDSIATLHLIINPVVTGEETITICEAALPYSWNNQVITSAGDYTATLISAASCDSIATLHLIVNPVVTGEETITICETALPYSWNNQSITAAGDYSATLTSAAGCDSIATLHLIVNPVVTGEETITICETAFPYSWNNQSITAGGDYTATLVSAAGCDSIATLHLIVSPVVTGEETITICEAALPYNWNNQSITAGGDYTATLTSAASCDSIATLHLIVNPVVTGEETITICEAALPYNWNNQVIAAAGDYSTTLISAAGCDSIGTLHLIINPIVTGEETITICETALPYNWNNQSISTGGDYTAALISINGCDSIVTLHLIINPVVTGEESITVCEAALPYSWNSQIITVAGDYTTTLVSINGCDSIATLHIITNPVVTGEETITICETAIPYSWNNQSITAAGDYTTTLVSATGCDSIATLHLIAIPVVTGEETITICETALPYNWNNQSITAAGDYTTTLVSATGCDSIATLHLIANPVVTGEETITICETALPYNWNNQSITAAGDYTTTLVSATGCDSIATLHFIANSVVTGKETITICETALPYNWNNQSITAAGDYTTTLVSATGCDSIATLHLIVNPVVTGEETITICEAALPYSWNNQVITSAGDYTATLIFAASCDSIATLHLIINPVVRGEETITICESSLPYSWNNQTIAAAGDYTAILESVNGCDSIATLHLLINPVVTSDETISICEAALPYSWNNQFISIAGNYTATFASATGCDSIATLHLLVTPQPPVPIVAVSPAVCNTLNGTITVKSPAPGSTSAYSINGADFQSGNIFNALAPGNYTITVKDINGCTTSLNVSVGQSTNIFTINQTVTHVTCTAMNGSIDVTASGSAAPYTYAWTGPNNFSSTNEDIDGLVAGDYTVIVIDANGCTQTKTTTVSQSISTITLNQSVVNTICTASNGSINLTVNNGTAPYNYSWTGPNNFSSSNEDLSGLSEGEYPVTVTDDNGCTASSTINVTQVVNTITLNKLVTNATCNSKDGSIDLLVNGGTAPYTHSWTGPSGYTTSTEDLSNLIPGNYAVTVTDANGCTSVTTAVVDQTEMTPTVVTHDIYSCSTANLTEPTVTAGSEQGLLISYWQDAAVTNPVTDPTSVLAGMYYVKGTNSFGCSSVKPVIVTIEATPLFITANPEMKCDTETVDLTAPAITAGSDPRLIFTYWNDAGATNPLVNPQAISKSGTYYIMAQAIGGCSFVKSVEVVVTLSRGNKSVRYPTVNASPNVPVQLNAREPGLINKYTWNPPTGLNAADRKDPEFRHDQNMEYTVRIEYDNQCPVIDTVLVLMRQITTNCVSDIFVPKAWSPNNDRHNDKLFPIPVCIRELKYFRVFNRWGQLVFETNVLQQGWDGIFKGTPQVMDTYTWTLEATGEDGKHFKRAGNSVLVR